MKENSLIKVMKFILHHYKENEFGLITNVYELINKVSFNKSFRNKLISKLIGKFQLTNLSYRIMVADLHLLTSKNEKYFTDKLLDINLDLTMCLD